MTTSRNRRPYFNGNRSRQNRTRQYHRSHHVIRGTRATSGRYDGQRFAAYMASILDEGGTKLNRFKWDFLELMRNFIDETRINSVTSFLLNPNNPFPGTKLDFNLISTVTREFIRLCDDKHYFERHLLRHYHEYTSNPSNHYRFRWRNSIGSGHRISWQHFDYMMLTITLLIKACKGKIVYSYQNTEGGQQVVSGITASAAVETTNNINVERDYNGLRWLSDANNDVGHTGDIGQRSVDDNDGRGIQ